MMDEVSNLLDAIDTEISLTESRLSYRRTYLGAMVLAISSIFWSLVAILETNQFTVSDILSIAPFFVSATLFYNALLLALAYYHLELHLPTKEDITSSAETHHFNPEDIMWVTIGLLGIGGSALAICQLTSRSLAEFLPYGLVFGLVVILLALEIWGKLNVEGMGKVIVKYTDIVHPARMSRKIIHYLFYYVVLGGICLNYAWHSSSHTAYFSLGILLFAVISAFRFSLRAYGELVENGERLRILISIRRWIILDKPKVEEIEKKYRSMFRTPTSP